MNLENRIEVGSVSEFLDAVKQIYCDQDHQLFYRGVSKIQYAAPQHDHPGIYRNKNWIDNEDKMFYELTAKCPEYFKDCKTTFEHLVMMQHYGYPTRLLDITSNPLVALYFACGGLNGFNAEDGQLISYNIKKNDINNYDSDRISAVSNVTLSPKELLYRRIIGVFIRSIFSECSQIYNEYLKSEDISDSNHFEFFPVSKKDYIRLLLKKLTSHSDLLNDFCAYRIKNSMPTQELYDMSLWLLSACYEKFPETGIDPQEVDFRKRFIVMYKLSKHLNDTLYNQYFNNIRKDKQYFKFSFVKPSDLRTIQCVLPKQNNPRLIAQQGAFLLFGFKDAVSDKTATPIIPNKMYGTAKTPDEKNSGEKIKIIIKGSEKQKILDELKILGISNSTMFPEIDNIANELKSQYAKPL